MKIGKKLTILLIVLIIIISFVIIVLVDRCFYKVGDMTFTLLKTENGTYIMPYIFIGKRFPKNNYILASNRIEILIYIDDDSSLYIFPTPTQSFCSGEHEIKDIKLPSFKYYIFPTERENGMINYRAHDDKIENLRTEGYSFIYIYIPEMLVEVSTYSKKEKTCL